MAHNISFSLKLSFFYRTPLPEKLPSSFEVTLRSRQNKKVIHSKFLRVQYITT